MKTVQLTYPSGFHSKKSIIYILCIYSVFENFFVFLNNPQYISLLPCLQTIRVSDRDSRAVIGRTCHVTNPMWNHVDWLKATFHLTISMCGERATGKIERNNYHHGSCGPSLKGKASSVSLIFMHRTHRNVKNR